VFEAVKQKAFALQFASDEMKADRAIVLEAVKQRAFVLQFASNKIKADRAIVFEAVKRDALVLELQPVRSKLIASSFLRHRARMPLPSSS